MELRKFMFVSRCLLFVIFFFSNYVLQLCREIEHVLRNMKETVC